MPIGEDEVGQGARAADVMRGGPSHSLTQVFEMPAVRRETVALQLVPCTELYCTASARQYFIGRLLLASHSSIKYITSPRCTRILVVGIKLCPSHVALRSASQPHARRAHLYLDCRRGPADCRRRTTNRTWYAQANSSNILSIHHTSLYIVAYCRISLRVHPELCCALGYN